MARPGGQPTGLEAYPTFSWLGREAYPTFSWLGREAYPTWSGADVYWDGDGAEFVDAPGGEEDAEESEDEFGDMGDLFGHIG